MKVLELKFSTGSFFIRLWPTLITAIMLVVLLGLGKWQVERLHWKQDLLHAIDERLKMAPIDASTVTDPENFEYRPVKASGQFQIGQEMYLHAISLTGQGGYHIIAPLKLDNGKYLLVDRGWVPLDLRDPSARLGSEAFGASEVSGLLRLPHHHWMQPKNDPQMNEWYGYDLNAMGAKRGLPELLPFILEVDNTPNEGGYPVGGQTRVDLPNNHLVYAFIWYSLALGLLVIYGVSGWRKLS